MNTKSLIRVLLAVNFGLFLLPFFSACSNNAAKSIPTLTNEVSSIFESDIEVDEVKFENSFKEINNKTLGTDPTSLNAYEIVKVLYTNMDKDMIKEPFAYFCLSILAMMLAVLLAFLYSLIGRFRQTKKLNIMGLAFLLLALLIAYASEVLVDLDQIKVGMYLYLANALVLLVLLAPKSLSSK